jgi:uncharacterized protein YkwD
VQDALVTLVLVVVAIGAVVAVYTVATSGHAYREIGKGAMDAPAAEAPAAHAPPEDGAEELRDLLEARNRLRAKAGLEPLDVDAEVTRRLRDLN